MSISHTLPDRHQNFWQLTCIQSAAQSLPGIFLGGALAQNFGASIAITSICVGNLILWFIGWAVISIAAKGRKNAIESVREYLGKAGSIFMAITLMIAFLAWYMIEINSSVIALSPLIQPNGEKGVQAIGLIFGLLIAVLAIGGIRLIRRICVFGFPLMAFFALYLNINAEYKPFSFSWVFSFPAIITVIALNLPGTVNLPTFFRHSNSRSDSLLALTLITIFDALFLLSTVFTGMSDPAKLLMRFSEDILVGPYLLFATGFIVISLVCLNLVNIYFSSAALQVINPRLSDAKRLFLVGVLGSVSFVLFQSSQSMIFLENIVDNFISNLGVVLLISFLVKMIVRHRIRIFEKSVGCVCLLVGCAISVLFQILDPQNSNQALLAGAGAILLSFLIILFLEETIWSGRKLNRTKG